MQNCQEFVDKKVKNYNRGLLLISEVVRDILEATYSINRAYREICLKEAIRQLTTKN